MKYLKEHISTIVSITILLIGFQTYTFMNQMLDAYKNKLLEDYSIVVVSKEKLSLKSFTQTYIKSIKEIELNSSIESLKDSISNENFKLLRSKMPNFYSVTLKKLPNQERLEQIKKELKEYKFIKKVEVFSKTHAKLFSFFCVKQLSNNTTFLYRLGVVNLIINKRDRDLEKKHTLRDFI